MAGEGAFFVCPEPPATHPVVFPLLLVFSPAHSLATAAMDSGFQDLKAPSAFATIAEVDGVFGKSFPSRSLTRSLPVY